LTVVRASLLVIKKLTIVIEVNRKSRHIYFKQTKGPESCFILGSGPFAYSSSCCNN
jgi:hypothetical protein